ncbi:hypothetical protein [Bacillus mycoides]|uniref:hypothetical protein n=1 Tax=Bacillus mycoides TaxID=1405 RepID=UPI000278F458|nr:hypothetical protein [Bacillus mycoides]EJQ55144.1 hypothetical protein IEW_05580 [Bacillus mycoides]EJQ57756.1 hypothetical protein IEY_05573 [Bacillus mycoides]EJV59612.1 hypothetical protein IEU_05539 [Bacillus mycoides]MDR4304891.1 hypothetical protein [Bacillus mycoides]
MCACEGTGVIRNDMGTGMYQFAPCICEVGNQTPEEVDRKRYVVMTELREIHQLQLEGKWDAETWNGFGKGELHNRSTAKEVHEEIAS